MKKKRKKEGKQFFPFSHERGRIIEIIVNLKSDIK